MVGNSVLVLDHLAVQFVHQIVNRGIQVGMGAFSEQVAAFVERTGADEILLCGATYDAEARIRSLELTLDACQTVPAA